MAATAGDAEDDLQRALALSRAEAGIEAPPSAVNPPVDLASALEGGSLIYTLHAPRARAPRR